ncbi:putative E3 ubiquitin-protein ligase XBAT34 [Ricinus communis]|uniref:putative E3 ubiquitin-protein ligase XBAT34 n=1 Tax=Ricinus communis TaxID=3988 RepID=UPI00201A27E1|nr:putative E3 ubiquitin-protein ligase XBAT34 [Ricinus communis]
MGQNLDSMTQNQSKEDILYHLVITGNVNAIKALCREGVNLECIDKEGKTPLIVACMDSGLFNVATTLIQLGANVNAYRPGRHAGTPLHHAAKRGLEQTVLLLLSSGANALVRNDDCHTALNVARIKGHTNVVRAIENHICFFSGWLREFHGPGFLEALAPQLLSRKIWVVIIPCGASNPMKPLRLELAIYTTLQDAQPRTIIALWKAKIEGPKFNQSDPGITIFDNSTKTRYKLASSSEGDKQQLHRLYDACRGISQVMPPATHNAFETAMPDIMRQTSEEALDLAMAISASIQSASEERPPLSNTDQSSETNNANGWGVSVQGESHNGWGPAVASSHLDASSSGWMDNSKKEDYNYNGWDVPNSRPIGDQGRVETRTDTPVAQTSGAIVATAPSAPPIPDEALGEGPIRYPSIDFGPLDSLVPPVEHGGSAASDVKNGGGSSSCIICWEAPIEGACIPCGHMAGCMACLSEINAKKGVCPVCRAKIKQVIRLYAV